MHDLVFSKMGDERRLRPRVRVSWHEGVYEFRLTDERGLLVTADRSYWGNAPALLEAFLYQVAGDLGPGVA
jgi:hypothetical protein